MIKTKCIVKDKIAIKQKNKQILKNEITRRNRLEIDM